MAKRHDLRIDQGSTYELVFDWRNPLRDAEGEVLTDSSGDPLPGTPRSLSGYQGLMHVRRKVSDSEVLLELSSPDDIKIEDQADTVLEPVRAATVAEVLLEGTQTVDGVALAEGDRVLVKDQTASEDDGVYEVSSGTWPRASDAVVADNLNDAAVFVEEGTENKGKVFRQTATLVDLTSPQVWARDLTTGRVLLYISDEKTQTISQSGVYDLELESPEGERFRVLQGKVRLSAEVTREEETV